MDAKSWAKVQEIFLEASELPEVQRNAFLGERCADAPELLAEVISLLESAGQTHGAIEALGGGGASSAVGMQDGVGDQIGPYRLVRILGQGGMGVVWLADQAEPIRRQVALKIIKRGMDTHEVVARFEAERQALALMDHPSIAHVYGAGATPDGLPYFAMEVVLGPSIVEYCDTNRLTTRARLELFAQVCRATQHAHQKGVIHRDLKPSNVMVTEKDGVAVPKVIDFGIAKATGAGLTDHGLVTLHGQVVGTPTYMSPEQAGFTDSHDIDTRTDIYSLGVVLYELLVGAPPIDLRKVALQAISAAILTTAVPRPSAKATSLGASLAAIAESRRTSPEALKRDLKDDLDWIILKAIDKDRTRRYHSAAGFADDIERRLSHEPVVARPPSTRYRVGKFVRRHRVGALTATAALLGVLGFGVTTSLQAERIRIERDKALNVSNFMEDLFKGADPMAARAERRDTLRLTAFLAEGAKRVHADLGEQPEVQAHMLDVIGSVFRNWGQYDEAAPLLEEALQIREGLHPDGHSDLVRSQESLGLLRLDQASFDEAETRLLEVVRERRANDKTLPVDLARPLQALGNVHQAEGDFAEAERWYREALETLLATGNEPPSAVAQAQSNLGAVLYRLAQYEESEELQQASLATERETLGADHPRVATHLNNLAFLLEDTGRQAEAEPMFREALAIRRARLGPAHPLLAMSINNLASTRLDLGDYDEARDLFEESLAMRRELLGPDHPNVGIATSNMAAALSRMGHLEEAEELYVDATRILLGALGTEHPAIATVTGNHAALFHRQGQHDRALPLYRRALEIRRAKLAEGHFLTASLVSDLGRCLAEFGSYVEAEQLLLEARDLLAPQQDMQARRWKDVHSRLAEFYDARGRTAAAERFRALSDGP